MAAPFPEAQFEALIYILLGAMTGFSIAAGIYIRRLHRRLKQDKDENDLRTDNIGLSKRAQDTIDAVLEEDMLQSDLPSHLEVSKATVSQAVSELHERGLIKKKKRANTYLIEPDRQELRNQQR